MPMFYLKYAFLNPQYSIDKLTAYTEHDYLPTANDVFKPETGEYNKAVRDAEGISDIESFMANNEGFYQWLAAYGPHITIEAPKNMRQHYIEYLKKTLACYEKADDNYETQ